MMFEKQPAHSRSKSNNRRRSFAPPKPRPQRSRHVRDWPPPDWRSRVPPAMLRAFIGASFASLTAFTDRFGDATLPLACVALAIFAGISAYLILRSEAHETWGVAAADAVVLVLVIPLVTVASDVLVADEFLGGGVERFIAAALAVGCAVGVVAVLSAHLGGTSVAALAFLSATLVVSAGFVGAQRFSADAFADGMSLAWMVAAVITLGDGLVAVRSRPLLPVGATALFLVLMVALARTGGVVNISETSALVALLASAVVAGMLLYLPILGERWASDGAS